MERITQKALNSLPEYSLSNPTGAFPGKVWKRALNPYEAEDKRIWVICEYVKHPTDIKLLRVEYRKPEVLPAPRA